MAPWYRRLKPTGNWVLALIAPTLVFVATGLQRTYQTDFWHHLARGRAIVTEGHILDEDRFTYTVPGKALQDANWLTQVIYFKLYEAGGLALVQLVNSITLTAVMALLVGLCARTSGSLRLAALLGMVAFFGMWQVLLIRPQTFSLLLFVLVYLALHLSDERPWLLVLPPLLLGLWANLHGGFPIGFLPTGCFLLGAAWDAIWAHGWGFLRDRKMGALAVCLAGSVLATLVNPYGWKVYQYVLTVSTVATGRPIMEWQPPGLTLIMSKVWMASVLLVVVSFALSKRRPSARDLCLVLCFLTLSCGAIRMVPWWLLISMPIVAAQLGALLPAAWLRNLDDEQPSLVAGVFAGLLTLLAVSSAPGMDRYLPLPELLGRAHRTEDDLRALAEHLPSDAPGTKRIFCRFEWGEYLGWVLEPRGYTVFMDGRIEIFDNKVWAEYMAVNLGRADWQKILDGYGVDWLILDTTYPDHSTSLIPFVEKSGAWKEVARSGDAVLFERVGAKP